MKQILAAKVTATILLAAVATITARAQQKDDTPDPPATRRQAVEAMRAAQEEEARRQGLPAINALSLRERERERERSRLLEEGWEKMQAVQAEQSREIEYRRERTLLTITAVILVVGCIWALRAKKGSTTVTIFLSAAVLVGALFFMASH
jgi:hypothetical protein